MDKKLEVPWLPNLDSETDTKHIDPEFTGEEVSASVGQSLISNSLYSGNQAFVGFSYVPENKLN